MQYYETSAKQKINVCEVFENLINAVCEKTEGRMINFIHGFNFQY